MRPRNDICRIQASASILLTTKPYDSVSQIQDALAMRLWFSCPMLVLSLSMRPSTPMLS